MVFTKHTSGPRIRSSRNHWEKTTLCKCCLWRWLIHRPPRHTVDWRSRHANMSQRVPLDTRTTILVILSRAGRRLITWLVLRMIRYTAGTGRIGRDSFDWWVNITSSSRLSDETVVSSILSYTHVVIRLVDVHTFCCNCRYIGYVNQLHIILIFVSK